MEQILRIIFNMDNCLKSCTKDRNPTFYYYYYYYYLLFSLWYAD